MTRSIALGARAQSGGRVSPVALAMAAPTRSIPPPRSESPPGIAPSEARPGLAEIVRSSADQQRRLIVVVVAIPGLGWAVVAAIVGAVVIAIGVAGCGTRGISRTTC